MDDYTDCPTITTTETPTTTEEAGCCKGDSHKTNTMCNKRLTRDQCERSSSCHFIKDGDVDDECAFGTTEPPAEPGCCYVNPAGAYSKPWQDTCTGYFTERECLFNTDDSGVTRCVFEPMNEYMDCEALWPTTTETPTEPAGCCYGDDYKQNDRCAAATSQSRCEEMGCRFLVTDDPSDCEMTTTESATTTEEVGCCKGDSLKTNPMCNARTSRAQCERSSSCHFIVGGVVDEECLIEPPSSTTLEPGCCYGNPDTAYSKRWMDQCKSYYTERECLMLEDEDGNKRCTFEPMNEYMDCEAVWPTTTESPTEPAGCCKGSSYKAQAKCLGLADQKSCERKSCEWIVTMIPEDCDITTTDAPTTTVVPGCCAHTSYMANDKCNSIEDKDQCNRRSSCHFIEWGILDIDCIWVFTEPPPSEPGCCYGNPDIAYSKRWMDQCKTFGTEAECLMLKNHDGEPRCYFEPLGEYEDCETVWPTTTTTTEEVGCCYADSYKANDKCGRATDRARCESMGCSFLVTDDPKDCEMTTTESPTTTEEVGCCYGEGVKENEMCGNKEGRDQCERSGKCEFRSGTDADCTYNPPTSSTTTPEPGCCYGDTAKTNGMCAEKTTRDQCERSGKCEFRSGYGADCELPTTTSEPWLGEKDEAVLFGEQGTTLSEAMNTQISLSTLLLFAVVALAVQQLYRCYANSASRDGYTKLAEAQPNTAAYQMA